MPARPVPVPHPLFGHTPRVVPARPSAPGSSLVGMSLSRRLSRVRLRHLWRGVRWYVGTLTFLQAVTIAVIVVVDRVRKQREPAAGEFPRVDPTTVRVANGQVTVFTYGADLYRDMIERIEQAERFIYFETFIWKADETGHAVKTALLDAARRGVEVYIVFDSFGNGVVPRAFKRFPRMRRLHVLPFPFIRPGLLTGDLRKTGRDHRKILVVDGRTGYVGGYNIGDLYATTWRDTHIRVDGSSTWELEHAFASFWNDHRKRRHPIIEAKGARSWDARIRAHQNNPSRLIFPVRGTYLDAIDRAQHHVYITQAYFIPDREILGALVAAAERGVDVRVLIPEVSNHVLADWPARSQYTELLEAGVSLWLYQDAMIHAKTMTVDGRWTTVGTTNIDRLSMTGNFEINLEIFDRDLAKHMESVFYVDLTNSRRLTLQEWEARGILARVAERLLKPLAPLL
ncbi:cardiolipin synthase [Bogoriella caseilytica]|uniref:Cardiolipin synthase n=2 Tax=Bogoriella caseilytica TaxID=56055 RepID=A0A3N2B9Z5_9MICO|nr:cardiolipin synthase [Bogoriella caseilytica]